MIATLSKYPVLGTSIRFITGKARLFVEYVLLALLVAAVASCVTLWMETKAQKQMLNDLRYRITQNEATNAAQTQTIAELSEARLRDAAATAGLIKDFEQLAKLDRSTQRKLKELERKNVAVRSYLDQPVPPELGCLLDGSCAARAAASRDQAGKGAATGKPDPAVRGAAGQPGGGQSGPG